jgi:hypothetical protein
MNCKTIIGLILLLAEIIAAISARMYIKKDMVIAQKLLMVVWAYALVLIMILM